MSDANYCNRKLRQPMEDPLEWASWAWNWLHSQWLRTTYPFASVGRDLSVHCTCELRRPHAVGMKLGNSVLIAPGVWLNVADEANLDAPVIVLDDRVRIGRWTQISAKNCIHLERDVSISPSVLLMDHNHSYSDPRLPVEKQGLTTGGQIRIECGCWIGHGAAIICGHGQLVIGRNSVVAANALVTRSFPAYCVIAGNPARIVKQWDGADQRWVLGAARPAEAATLPQEAAVS